MIRHMVGIGVLAVLPWAAYGQAPGVSEKLRAFFEEFAKKRESIEALTADFTQENMIDGEPFVSAGTVRYAKPKRILFLYQDAEALPEAPGATPRAGRAYALDHLTMYEYDPDLEQVRVQKLEDRPEVEALFLGFSEDFTQIREVYQASFFETGDESIGLQLSPKETAAADEQYFQWARMWLRPHDYLPARVEVQVTEDSLNTYYLSSYELHEALPRERMQILVPAGTTVVTDDSVEELTEDRAIPPAAHAGRGAAQVTPGGERAAPEPE